MARYLLYLSKRDTSYNHICLGKHCVIVWCCAALFFFNLCVSLLNIWAFAWIGHHDVPLRGNLSTLSCKMGSLPSYLPVECIYSIYLLIYVMNEPFITLLHPVCGRVDSQPSAYVCIHLPLHLFINLLALPSISSPLEDDKHCGQCHRV